MKTYSYFLVAFLITAVISCKKEANIKLPAQENKLVVTCFISPSDTLISAIVKASAPEYGQQQGGSDDITNATVVISDGASSVTLPFIYQLDAYVISARNFAIVSGKTYYLTVSTPDGKQVSGSTTVPSEQMSLQSVTTNTRNAKSTQSGSFSSESFDYDLTVVVNDIPNQTNYLEVFFQNALVEQRNDTSIVGGPRIDTAAFVATDPFFATDENIAKSAYSYNYSSSFFGGKILSAQVNIGILNCSPEFYKYNESVQRANAANDNPFSEPVFVYTNIKNGFGCFGAYNANYQLKKIR